MCGIVGVASRRPLDETGLMDRMRDTLCHRGPDDAGTWRSDEGTVALMQRRLSIIDLSPLGHQPMLDSTGRLSLVLNGEIYNFLELRRELEAAGHRFRGRSDTEVLLAAYREWDTACLQRLQGMFAFALWDADRRRLFIARDRAGEKPLFYRHAEGRLAFASELKALMADPSLPRVLDLAALEFYLAYGYVPAPRCMLAGVCKLEPGHALTWEPDRDRLTEWAYWELPAQAGPRFASDEELVDELERLLADSVRRQLVADVPVGVLLSGGVDSSLVTALAAQVSDRRVKTFTISFPGFGGYDESKYARLVAEHFGTEHVELAADATSVELLPELARQYDEPIADSSMVPTYLVSRLIRQHATVALGGDGGDELFGGYLHYSWLQQNAALRRFTPGPVRRAVGAAAARLPVGLRGRNHLIGLSAPLARSVAYVNLYFDPLARRRVLGPAASNGHSSGADPEGFKASVGADGTTLLRQATATDFRTYLADDILVKVDRASMLTSLEVRAPWLDHRIIEFAFGRVPDRLRATAQERKILPRMLGRKLLPPQLDLDRKQGFSLPLQRWFRGDWGAYMAGVLREAHPGLFDRAEIDRLVRGQLRGFSNTHRIFALTMFELWRREYDVEVPA